MAVGQRPQLIQPQTQRAQPAPPLQQAALLTAALPNPEARDPANPTRNLQARANRIAARARQAGDYIGCINP